MASLDLYIHGLFRTYRKKLKYRTSGTSCLSTNLRFPLPLNIARRKETHAHGQHVYCGANFLNNFFEPLPRYLINTITLNRLTGYLMPFQLTSLCGFFYFCSFQIASSKMLISSRQTMVCWCLGEHLLAMQHATNCSKWICALLIMTPHVGRPMQRTE